MNFKLFLVFGVPLYIIAFTYAVTNLFPLALYLLVALRGGGG